MPAPGPRWVAGARRTAALVFGQWLSGMSRMSRATGDSALRDKAVGLLTEWAKTVGPDGNCAHGSLPVRQARLRARRSAACTPDHADAANAPHARDRVRGQDIPARARAARRHHRQPGVLRPAAGVVHAGGESVPRATSSPATRSTGRSPRSGCITRTGTSSRRPPRPPMRTACTPTATSTRSAAPRWRTTSRGDAQYLDDHQERLRLPAADPVLRDRRIRPERAVHEDRTAAWGARSTRGPTRSKPSADRGRASSSRAT